MKVGAETQAILAQYKAEVARLREYADGETDKLRDALRQLDEQNDELERLRGAVPPPGWLITKQSELDRLHNESEARLIERDQARAEVAHLRVAHLRVALLQIREWGTYGYQDLNSGGVLACVRRLADATLNEEE